MFARAIRPGANSGAAPQRLARPLLRTTTLTSTPILTTSHRSSKPACNLSNTRKFFHVSTIQASQPKKQYDPEFIPNTNIHILRTAQDIRQWRRHIKADDSDSDSDRGVALVPTMGALHEGHVRLIREAAQYGHDKILVSIYVNPAQFGVTEDLDSYPKTWNADCAVLANLAQELEPQQQQQQQYHQHHHPTPALHLAVFAPTTAELYPSGPPGQAPDSKGSFVTITPVSELLEGKTRPTFFRGVATVCMKLFHLAAPARVFFGQKDVQQTVVVRKMVRDFCMPIAVAVVPTVREPRDGLALSSRNVYLGTRRRRVAPVLIEALRAAERAYLEDGADAAGVIVPAALRVILDVLEAQMKLDPGQSVMFELDYISLADPDTMEEIEEVDPAKGAILSGAIKMLPVFEVQDGEDLGLNNGPPVRLIDNIILPPRNKVGGDEDK